MNLKQKTIAGLTWSFIEHLSKEGILFIIGIVLARLLSPREFGLVGMITIFIVISEGFIDSGFGQALVRKKNCNQADYSTVFYYNFLVGIILYLILFFSAGAISSFFREPQLVLILKVLGIVLVIKSFTLIHLIILIKRIDFKLQTKITIVSSTLGGIVGIYCAYNGYGVWSLVVKTLSTSAIASLLLWVWNKWKPSLIFSIQSFKELFAFGSKLMLSGLLNRAYKNVFLLVIGKYFSAADLGFYTRADQFKNLPSQNITGVIQRVSYPALSSIQEDIPRMKTAYQKLIRSTMLITFFLMFGLAAMAKPMVLTLIGEKWLESVVLLQLLCFVGIFYPLQALNQNMLKVQGLSNTVLTLEIIKKVLVAPVIFTGIYYGIIAMVLGMILHGMVGYIIDSYYSGRVIGYSIYNQIKDILPSFLTAVVVGGIVFFIGTLLKTNIILTFGIQLLAFIVLTVSLFEILKLKDYLFIKEIMMEKIFSYKLKPK